MVASPQVENGYIRIATELFEALTRTPLNDSERRVLQAVIRQTYGYNRCRDSISFSQLEDMTDLSRVSVNKALRKLELRNIIIVERTRLTNIIAIQKDYEKWANDVRTHGGSFQRGRNILREDETSKPGDTSNSGFTSKPGVTKTSKPGVTHNRQKTYIPIFEHWNSKGIIKHRALTEKMKRAINGRLREGYSLEDILKAIDNYQLVLNDPAYYWSHRWTLQHFLQRGLETFIDEANPLDNFRVDKGGSKCLNADLGYPRSRMTESTLKRCKCEECRQELARRKEK